MKSKLISLAAVICILSLFAGSASAATRKPANDDVRRAFKIAATEFTGDGTLAGATLQSTEPQPSCGAITSSVWYRFEAPLSKKFAADVQTTFGATVTAYRTQDNQLIEVACSIGTDVARIEFPAVPGEAILVQVASTTTTKGSFTLTLAPSRWQERTIHSYTFDRQSGETKIPLLRIKGAPRATDPSMYDLSVGVSNQRETSVGLLTFGLLKEEINQELVTIPASATHVSVVIAARYDTGQQKCLADGGPNSSCQATSPVSDPAALLNAESGKTDLVIHVTAIRNGQVLVDQALSVPLAGQATAILP